MIYVTGDTHCPIDIHKLSNKRFDQRKLTKEDYVIICGDAGFVWNPDSREDEYWQEWLNNKNFTTLFTDGNHENHAELDSYPTECWHGGKAHKIQDGVIHLMRGQVYSINDKRFFTMGGATSVDKACRKENISWWAREMPSCAEYEEALDNLDDVDWDVDYIITHHSPSWIQREINPSYKEDPLTKFLDYIRENCLYSAWFFGHYHTDRDIYGCHHALYDRILEIE